MSPESTPKSTPQATIGETPGFTSDRRGPILSDYEISDQSKGVRNADGEPFDIPEDIRVDAGQPPRPSYASNGRPQKGDTVNPYAPYAFALRRGSTTGKSNIYNGRLFITVARKNGENDYESEEPVPYFPENMTFGADYETTELDFSGDVWVCWGDVEDGVPGYVEVRSSASGEFNVKVGSIADPIQQEIHGDIHWVWFETGSSSSIGSTPASSGSSKASSGSSKASSAIGSSKDTAVVPGPDGTQVKWYAMEASEVLFFDFQEFKVKRGVTHIPIDPVVLFGIERDTARAFASPDRGTAHVTVKDDQLVIASRFPGYRDRKQVVQVMIKATRRGFKGVRNAFATFDDMVDNECRLNPRMTREQVLELLSEKGVTE